MSGAGRRPDEAYTRRALDLAARGLGRTSPNPAVGAVVVADGEIVGEGWHQRAGEPHAEPIALAAAGDSARNATIYVSLEPCCHHGRTPPCTDAIIEAGIRRVVYACPDCDDRCAGQGAQALAAAGIEVTCGPLGEQARRLNEAYFKHKRTGLPFVTLKMACSLDGKTATRTGDSKWVTGEATRARVHQMRDQSDAVMVGIGTVLADDPRLTTRLADGEGRDALRVVVDPRARTPTDARVVAGESEADCLIAVTGDAPQERVEALQKGGAEVIMIRGAASQAVTRHPSSTRRSALQSATDFVDLLALMTELGRRDVMSVLLEGGGTLAAGAVAAGIVDKVVFFYAPKLIGGEAAPTALEGLGVETIAEALKADITAVERIGEDIMVEAYLCSQD